MLKMFYLHGFIRWTKCIWCVIENNYLLVNRIFEFAVEFHESNIKQTLSPVQKITCITATGDKKIIISLFCVSGVLCSLPQAAAPIK